MREPLRVEALADTVTAEPTSGLAESPLDVGRRERAQRISHWIDVSRCSHGFPNRPIATNRGAHLRNTGSVAHTRSPSRLALRGNTREGEIDEGGRDGYRRIEFGQHLSNETFVRSPRRLLFELAVRQHPRLCQTADSKSLLRAVAAHCTRMRRRRAGLLLPSSGFRAGGDEEAEQTS
jgi:hypothetical protein